jgi:crotonobetainyl-CoA:carnitine CoA-transferase CaiB-like acyl-CoA transferase
MGGNQVTGYFASGKIPQRYGNAHASLVPYQVFDTADGQMVVAVGNDVQWQRYCEVIERHDLAAEGRWRKVAGRITGREELIPELAKAMLTRTSADWIDRLEARDVPCGPINNYMQVFEDPQVRHRGLRVDVPRDSGAVSTIASPLRLQDTPAAYEQAPPLLGEHTDEVLARVLGKSRQEIRALRERGVV